MTDLGELVRLMCVYRMILGRDKNTQKPASPAGFKFVCVHIFLTHNRQPHTVGAPSIHSGFAAMLFPAIVFAPMAFVLTVPAPNSAHRIGKNQVIACIAATPPTRTNVSLPPMQNNDNERHRKAPSFADPGPRIARTVKELKLPALVELLRARLPPEYKVRKPLWDDLLDTEQATEVIVSSLLALTDGKLDEMQAAAAAQAESVERINSGARAARSLGRGPTSGGRDTGKLG